MELRAKRQPKNVWREEVINDLRKPKLRKCSQHVKGRNACNDQVHNTKTPVGLLKCAIPVVCINKKVQVFSQ